MKSLGRPNSDFQHETAVFSVSYTKHLHKIVLEKKNPQNHSYYYSPDILFPAILTGLVHISNQPYQL